MERRGLYRIWRGLGSPGHGLTIITPDPTFPETDTPMRHWLLLSLLLPLAALANPPTTSNLAREKAWADEVADQVVVGDAIWLRNRGQKFLGLYAAPASKAATKAVILIHGRGVHPAWGFIENLRIDLTEAGYHTLSLQMPILENEAKFLRYAQTFPEANERIDAGVA